MNQMPFARILEYELYDVCMINKSSFMSQTVWRTNSRSIIHYLTDLKVIESPDRSPHPSFQSAIGVCPILIWQSVVLLTQPLDQMIWWSHLPVEVHE
jgi:hypothetical protein